jgi:2'-5' RNA ligase
MALPSTQNRLWRVFCAIELPAGLKARVAEYSARLREAIPQARASWERPEKLHLTLKFIGELEEARVEVLARATERAAQAVSPFELSVVGMGTFPPKGLPRVLWLGIEDVSGNLSRLHGRLEDECAREGLTRETRPFHPHLTLARVRSREGAERLGARHREGTFEPQTFTVSEVVVMRSELGPGGSKYTPVSRQQLSDL